MKKIIVLLVMVLSCGMMFGQKYTKKKDYSEGLAAVYFQERWGFVDKNNKLVINYAFEDVKPFNNGVAQVKYQGKWIYIDKKGKVTSVEVNKPKPKIEWQNVPKTTTEPMFVLKAEIKSESKIEYCKVFLNNSELQDNNAPGGSTIVEDQKKKDDKRVTVNKTLALREGTNTIRIKVKNAGGETDEQKTIEYKPDKPALEKAVIVWNEEPKTTKNQQFELKATVKSTAKDASCQVFLNNVEVSSTKGSTIVEDKKEDEYRYSYEVKRTLTLKEGDNTITISVKNAKGELVKSEQRTITWVRPALATIVWGEVPSKTEEKLLRLKAQIKTGSQLEYWHVTFNGSRTKGSYIVKDNYNISIDETFTLREGKNVIKIEAKSEGGEVAEERIVTYNPNSSNEKRIALVIGNADYQDIHFPKLKKTKEDAKAMHSLLSSYGFDLRPIVLDADKQKMRNAINEFIDEVGRGNYEVALIYYSGHGLSPDGGANYLIPIDARIEYTDEVKHNAINSKTELIARLEEKNCRVEILLLDCCNDCALAERGTKGAYDGRLARVYPKSHGISIIHAALPGKKAIEGNGKNSPFVESFIECTRSHPNVDWESFVNDFIYDVQIRTDNYQTPYPEGRIIGKPFYINPQKNKN